MEYIRKKDCNNVFFITVFLTVAVIYSIFSYLTPLIFDDILFQDCYIKHNNGSDTFSIKALIDFAAEVRTYDNGRLSNILSPIATMFIPRWLFSLAAGLGVSFMFYFMLKLSGIKRDCYGVAMLIFWICSLILLPWRNSIMVNDYLLNYLFSSLFILGFLLLLSRAYDHRLGAVSMAGGLVVAIAAGWFHEGFSVPLCGAIGLFAISRKFRMPWQWWVLTVAFGLSTLFVLLAPGILGRADREFNVYTLSDRIKVSFTVLPALVSVIGVFVVFLVIPKYRSVLKNLMSHQIPFLLTLSAVFAGMIPLMINSDPRAGWPAELYAMILLATLFSSILTKKLDFRMLFYPALALYLLTCLFFGNVLMWQYRFLKQHEEIERLLSKSESGTIFYDIINPRDVRLITLFLPVRYQWVTSLQYTVINNPDKGSEKYYSVVPAVLKHYSEAKADRLEGSANLSAFENVLVGSDGGYRNENEGRHSDEAIYNFETESGDEYHYVTCFRVRFKDMDGIWRMYIWPSSHSISGKIVKADFVKVR